MRIYRLSIIIATFALVFSACSGSGGNQSAPDNQAVNTTPAADPGPMPLAQVTEADIAKLKWLEGSWRGTGGDKPFYERIRFEGSTMIVETIVDGKVTDSGKFELKDGEWGQTLGDQRSAVSSITENTVQFVPAKVPGAPEGAEIKGSTFRFEKKDDGTWLAILDLPAKRGRPASQTVYKMEPWKSGSKEGKE